MLHPKAALIEQLQREGLGTPQYSTDREGPEHEPTFRSLVRVGRRLLGEGTGSNKREAERRAAEAAMTELAADAAASVENETKKGTKTSRKRGSRGAAASSKTGAKATPPATDAAATPADDQAFNGPWPLVPELLVESLRIADQRVDAKLRGDLALAGIEAFALRLYKDLLEDLGEVVDEEDA